MRTYCLYGAGGHAKDLAAQIIAEAGRSAVSCLVDDFNPDRTVSGIPVFSFPDAVSRFPDAAWIIAIGSPKDRKAAAARLVTAPVQEAEFKSSRSFVAHDVELAEGTQVFAGCVLSASVKTGRSVIVNYNCSVSHDSVLGNYATLSPGCTISGWVVVGDGVFLGAGATVINGSSERPLTIGEGAIVGAGAVVIADVAAGDTVAGVPARSIRGR